MPRNSYTLLQDEWDEFRLTPEFLESDYMHGRDISWVAQVAPFIEEFSYPDSIVFDPFAGLGTTLLGAGILGRKSAGIELDPFRFGLLQKRIKAYGDRLKHVPRLYRGDAVSMDFPQDVDAVVTNFPYFHAGDGMGEHNLYGISIYDAFIRSIEEVIVKCERSLVPGGTIVSFCQNIRAENGEMIPQAYDICKLLQKYFRLKEERILLYVKKEAEEKGPSSLTNRAHEYVFIAEKRLVAPKR